MMRGVLTLAAAAVVLALPVLADPAQAPADVFLPTQSDDQYLARDLLLFAKVHNADGLIIGDIEDLIFDASNQVVGVVMGTGGFLGFGEKRIAVKVGALQVKHEDGKVYVSLPQATKEVLDTLGPFQRKQPPKSLLDRAMERAHEFTDKSSVTAKDAYEKAKPALEKAGEAAKGALEKAEEKAAPALEKAKDVAKGAYDGARNALDKSAEPAPGTAQPATPPAETAPVAPAPSPHP
jgi:PRC-barrel domain